MAKSKITLTKLFGGNARAIVDETSREAVRGLRAAGLTEQETATVLAPVVEKITGWKVMADLKIAEKTAEIQAAWASFEKDADAAGLTGHARRAEAFRRGLDPDVDMQTEIDLATLRIARGADKRSRDTALALAGAAYVGNRK